MQSRMILFIGWMLFCKIAVHGQNNYPDDWKINFNETYYKIKVGKDGLYRIPISTLKAIGLDSKNANEFQMWNNGVEVPLHTTQSNGPLAADGYIEFYGKINDGKFDTRMYSNTAYQPSDKWSLLTDTSVYFLTINTSSENLRYKTQTNASATSTLDAEPFFNYTLRHAFKDLINPGVPNRINDVNVYSSSFDEGEGWVSSAIIPSKPLRITFPDLQMINNGAEAEVKINFFGGSSNTRDVSVLINGTSAFSNFTLAGYSRAEKNAKLSFNKLSGSIQLSFVNNYPLGYDQYMVGQVEIAYPRKFDFGNATNFEFMLDPSNSSRLLEINSFNHGAVDPVLLDLNSLDRFTGILRGSAVRFLVPPSSQKRNFVLLSTASDQINIVSTVSSRKFVDYLNPAWQGDYIIVTDSSIRKSAAGDAIENYRLYRSSAAGGSFKVAVADIAQLVDQFAFGIKQHPLAIKRFLQKSISLEAGRIKNILLVGKGVTYDQYRLNESSVFSNRLNMVPSFGSPASDHILASKDLSPAMQVPIGRISVINGDELNAYLEKLKQHEDLMNTGPAYQTIDKKGWTKNVLHLVAGGYVQSYISDYMREAAKKIVDTVFGASVTTIEKSTAAAVEIGNTAQIDQEFNNGISVVNYFGHSSLNAMEFNLDDPGRFNNAGKYPLFLANACTAGNNFFYDSLRIISNKKSISEAYVLQPQKGSIAFVASTHFGILKNLDDFIQRFYERLTKLDYFKTIGEIHQSTIAALQKDFGNLPNNLLTMEQILIHGDPAIKIHPHLKADYVVEDPMVDVFPQPLSVAESYYDLKLKIRNIGSAHNDSVKLVVKRDRSDGSNESVVAIMRKVNYGDSLSIKFPIDPKKDIGQQTISVTVDPENQLDEISESNNIVTKKFNILDNEIKPVYPHEFAIVNKWPLKLSASIGQFSPAANQYIMQVDTTASFNSPQLDSAVISSNGGIIEYLPNIRVADSTVLFWRVAKKPDQGSPYNWFGSSLTYLSKSENGWGQSSYFQFLKNTYANIQFEPSRMLRYSDRPLALFVQSRLKSNTTSYNSVEIGNAVVYNQSCDAAFGTLEFSLITQKTGRAIKNTTPPASGSYGSFVPNNCFANTDLYQFWFNYNTPQGRLNASKFFDFVPNGTILVLNHWNKKDDNGLQTVEQWNKDALYTKFIGIGFTFIDSFKSNLPFTMVAYKNELGNWTLLNQKIGKTSNDELLTEIPLNALQNNGEIKLPAIGPSKNWKSFAVKLSGAEAPSSDNATFSITGIDNDLKETVVYNGSLTKNSTLLTSDLDLSFVDAVKYPWIKLQFKQGDAVYQTPAQIKYVQVKYDPVPEGGLADIAASTLVSALDNGSQYQFNASFKNVSVAPFDSVKVIWKITDDKNKDSILFEGLKKKLLPGDTIQFNKQLDTRNLSTNSLISLSVNPQNAQPEQFMFNNYLQTRLKVNADVIPPLLDVTFDGVHILNGDVVSSKPTILIQLKDDNAYLPLNDTSLVRVKLRYPDGTLKSIRFDGDTLKFSPSENPAGGTNNTASIQFKPILPLDGDYELLVSAKDRSENASGATDFSVMFQVTNQSMISNLLNYPNPFTTSTAFVFTLTGSELPTNMRIQILTITGKIVKDITMAELGPLKIGNNITDYKWDGRDQYGQLLANGVYLYRVITDIKGKKIDKLNKDQYNTDQYFKSGYGKMYLMR